MNPRHLIIGLCGLAGLAQGPLIVNGRTIPAARIEAMVKAAVAQGQKDTPELRKILKENLINTELLYQRAQRTGFTAREDLNAQAEEARQGVFIRAMLREYVKEAVKEEEIHGAYAAYKAEQGRLKEYSFCHILLDTEKEARAVLAKLRAGNRFEDLARMSKDSGSATNGGLVDWAPADNFVPELAAVLPRLQPGWVHESPVKTQYGFHILRMEDVRSAKVDPLEEMRPKLLAKLQSQKLSELSSALRKGASIKD